MLSSLYSEEYYEQIMEMLEDPAVLKMLWIYMAGMILVSLILCFCIAKSSKLSKKYTFFGFLGMGGVFIVICRSMAKSGGLSPYFMWLGLLGIYGMIILAVAMTVTTFKKYSTASKNNQYPPQDNGEKKEENIWANDWEKRYEEARQNKESEQTGRYNLNEEYNKEQCNKGEYYNKEQYGVQDNGTICLNCGAAVAAGEKVCPHCGNQLR